MKPVSRSELLDLGAYEPIREAFRRRITELKRVRRVPLGSNMTVLFENHDTALFQIQEMLRTERISSEKSILHELETYNELVPGAHELSATVFIEYTERDERQRMLEALAGVEDRFYLEVSGEQVPVIGDRRPRLPDQTLAVHYVKFPLTPQAESALGRTPARVFVGVDHPAYTARSELSPQTVVSLREDLSG